MASRGAAPLTRTQDAPCVGATSTRRTYIAYSALSFSTQMLLAAIAGWIPVILTHRFGASALTIGLVLGIPPMASLVIQSALMFHARPNTDAAASWRGLLSGLVPMILGCLAITASRSVSLLTSALGLTAFGMALLDNRYRASLGVLIPADAQAAVGAWQAALKGLGILMAFGFGLIAGEDALSKGFVLCAAALGLTGAMTSAACQRLSPVQASAPRTQDTRGPTYQLLKLVSAHTCWWFAVHMASTSIVLFAMRDLGLGLAGVRHTYAALGLMTMTALVSALPVARGVAAYGLYRVLLCGLGVLAAAFLLALTATSVVHLYVFGFCAGVGGAVIQIVPYPMMIAASQAVRPTTLSGWFNLTLALANLVAMVATGVLAHVFGEYRFAFGVALVAVVGAGALVRGVGRR